MAKSPSSAKRKPDAVSSSPLPTVRSVNKLAEAAASALTAPANPPPAPAAPLLAETPAGQQENHTGPAITLPPAPSQTTPTAKRKPRVAIKLAAKPKGKSAPKAKKPKAASASAKPVQEQAAQSLAGLHINRGGRRHGYVGSRNLTRYPSGN